MPPPVNPALVKQERELLQKVRARSFAVTPKAIKVFGSVKVSWDVELPDSPLFDIEVQLNESTVAPKGEKTFTLQQSTGFALTAKTEHSSHVHNGRASRLMNIYLGMQRCARRLSVAGPQRVGERRSTSQRRAACSVAKYSIGTWRRSAAEHVFHAGSPTMAIFEMPSTSAPSSSPSGSNRPSW